MLALPIPTTGSVADLRRFINVADHDWPLVLAWLVAALYGRGPFPLLVFSAEAGSGKSTATRPALCDHWSIRIPRPCDPSHASRAT